MEFWPQSSCGCCVCYIFLKEVSRKMHVDFHGFLWQLNFEPYTLLYFFFNQRREFGNKYVNQLFKASERVID